jgi:hypothetical protein
VSLPILVAPEPGEPLYLYIAAAAEVVSMVLVVERMAQEGQEPEGSGPATGVRTVQRPVYYVSAVAELPELLQVKCLSPALEARPHLNGNNPSIPRI